MRVPVYLEFDSGMMRLGSVRIQGNRSVDAMKSLRLSKKPKRVLINANYDVLASESSSKEI